MAFPLELVTMGVGTLIGGFLKLSANAQAERQQYQDFMMESSREQANVYREAREFRGDWGFSWTRRTIAILGVVSVIVLPKLIAVLYPEIGVAYATSIQQRFLLFGETYPAVSWDHARRMILITPVDTHLISAIIGLFFGSEITKRR